MKPSTTRLLTLFIAVALALACSRDKEKSPARALEHAAALAKTVETDVGEVRAGLPEGAKLLVRLVSSDKPLQDDLQAVREALERARDKVQDLRVAKSTFFALAEPSGVVLRNDQAQDSMAGKNLFESFPALRGALEGKRVETIGQMPEAARVKGPDGQWVTAAPVLVDGKARALYVTGWSWSAYAYRLENSLRSEVRSQVGEQGKMPLLYVYMVVTDAAYGAPVSPEVNASAIVGQKPLEKLDAAGQWSTRIEITGRDFGLAVQRTPILGEGVAIAVLRTET